MAHTSSSKAKGAGNGGKRTYTRRIENAPKRPLSAYNLFFRAERERILRVELCQIDSDDITINKQTTKKGKRAHRKSHGAVNFSDMGKRVAAAWKALNEEGKAPFVKEAAKEMERYQVAKSKLVVLQPNPSYKEMRAEKRTSSSKDENKQPLSQSLLHESENDISNNGPSQQHRQQQQQQKKQDTDMGLNSTKTFIKGSNVAKEIAKEFLPPHPDSKNNRHPPSPTTTQDYAFQCEVCHKAIFPTYDECLQHEQECEKNGEMETIV